MVALAITLVITNILWLLYFQWWRKKKTLGSIIITDEDSLYVELEDHESMDKIRKSKDVIFSVHMESRK
uniref:Transmembrane alpha-helix domain protein n=1 Tax=Siphoviridae sp. ctmYS12 TaxID=2825652 RepID=A0A8S5P7F9_9CAUD|nr:MAG TPA: Transmembrane alpha-helix domain protein [Siphoviridae sp. ctmYS12]